MRLAAWRGAHSLWPGYFPITLARELGYYAREGVAVEVIYTEDQEQSKLRPRLIAAFLFISSPCDPAERPGLA